MQKLKLANDLFPGFEQGTKRCTVRAGRRDIKLGPLIFESTDLVGDPPATLCQKVFVTEVRYTMFGLLSDEVAFLDGGVTAEELKRAMYRFYPHLISSDEITIVFFDLVDDDAY
jgi:hypothetical protein